MPAVEATALQALRMLSVTLNRLIAEQPMPQGDRETLATLLDEIQKFVEITTELSDRETIAICGLVRGAQRVLGRLDFGSGPEQLRAAVSELSLRLATEALRIPDDPATGKPSPVKDKLLAYAAGVATIIFTPGVSAIFTELGTEAAKYITGAQ
jgi:hypothetical protein